MHAWAEKPEQLLKNFKSGLKGLSENEAAKRLEQYGNNEIVSKDRKTAFHIFIEQLINPLVLVLIIASVTAYFLGEKSDALIIVSIVIINSILGFSQEYRAEKTVRELKKLISPEAKVMRGNQKKTISAKLIVPGDIVYLNIGDIVPADIRLLDQEEMTIDESSLTGESIPVVKTANVEPEARNLPQYLKNMAFMGTHVMSGEGYGLVIATAENTFFGKTASYLKEPEQTSDFEKGLSDFSKMLLKIIVVMTITIFIVNTVLHHGLLESFLFALALAVGITPEALPVIITISLSKGAQKLAKAGVIIKKLSSIEDLGNMDVLCTDKTGTLTEGHLALDTYLNTDQKVDDQVLIYGMLCNEAIVNKHKVEGNIIDKAIWESKQKNKVLKTFKKYRITDHNEFDFSRRRMSVIVKAPNNKYYLVAKGALESLTPICSHILVNEKPVAVTPANLKKYLETINNYRKNGYSTICIAVKDWTDKKSTKEDEKGLTIIGFLAFVDPPRKSAKASLKTLASMNVVVKVLSGDDPLVTKSICEKVGLKVVEDRIYTGDELDKMNEKEFQRVVEKYNVFARIAPEHKYKIVKTLNTGKERTIAFMGDGINDAPAIKVADVGISVNTATGIAKEAADIIIMQKSLKVVTDGVIEGRKIFGNITKYIRNTASANYGNMFTVAASSLFLQFIPLLPSQILLNNLLSDAPMLTIATDNVDPEMLKKPKKLNLKMIKDFMWFFGILSSVFDLTLIFTMIFYVKANPALFRTAWFLESSLSQLIIAFSIRTPKLFLRSAPGKLFSIVSLVILVVVFLFIMTPIGTLFQFVPLDLNMILFVLGIVSTYFLCTEIAKRFFFKKFEF